MFILGTVSKQAAETGVTQVMNGFLSQPGLLRAEYPDDWQSVISECGADDLAMNENLLRENWVITDNNNAYRIAEYNNNDDEGILTVVGATNLTDDFDNEDNLNDVRNDGTFALATVEVTIPIDGNTNTTLVSPNTNMGNNFVRGDIVGLECAPTATEDNIDEDSGEVINAPSTELPAIPNTPSGVTSREIGPIDQSFDNIDDSDNFTYTDRSGNENNFGAGVALPLDDDLKAESADNQDGDTYYYTIRQEDDDSITDDLLIRSDAQVVLYLEGNIDIAGGDVIVFEGCNNLASENCNLEAERLQIYGGNGDDSPNGPDNGETTTQICINGTAPGGGFILAPDAEAGVAGGGAQDEPSMIGAIWVNQWSDSGNCGSSGNTLVIEQPGDDSWDALADEFNLDEIAPEVDGSPSNFQAQPVPVDNE